MRLIIEIEKEDFETIVSKYDTFPVEMKRWGINAIKSGIPLPKGHGRIADVDKMLDEMRATRTYDILFALERVKPIIEADKEERK